MNQQRAHLESDMAQLFAAKTPFLVIDTETSGFLKDPHAQVIEVSCVDADGRLVYNSLVKPDYPIPAKATEVHGLTNEDVALAPTFPEIWPGFMAHLKQYEVFYCYNKKFDHGMLIKTAQPYGLLLPPAIARAHKWQCMMEKYAEYHGQPGQYGGYKWQSLSMACRQMGVPMSEAHRATGDCLSTLALMRALAARGAAVSPTA